MTYRPITDVQPSLPSAPYADGVDIEWPEPTPISEIDRRSYSERVLIEHCCENCGQGFSSIKPSPRFCSNECRLSYSKNNGLPHAAALWLDPSFRSKITQARRQAGYPHVDVEVNRIKARTRTACKNAIRRCLRRQGVLKDGRTYDLLGYTALGLRSHLESLFLPEMTWENYGKWEIDHRLPIASFQTGTPLSVINALANLQPLWRADNRRKWKHVR